MNRVAKTLSLVAILLSLASGTAWAAIECTAASVCRGTNGPNTMYGSGSEDRIYGKGGADVIDATGGFDEVYGGDKGASTSNIFNTRSDFIHLLAPQ
jgi:Ca2+-binding RTX toxin-like protein